MSDSILDLPEVVRDAWVAERLARNVDEAKDIRIVAGAFGAETCVDIDWCPGDPLAPRHALGLYPGTPAEFRAAVDALHARDAAGTIEPRERCLAAREFPHRAGIIRRILAALDATTDDSAPKETR